MITVKQLVEKLLLIENQDADVIIDSDYPDINTLVIGHNLVTITEMIHDAESKALCKNYKFIEFN